MKAKEFLNEYLICQGRINSKKEKIAELKETAVSLSYSMSEKVQTTKQIHGTEKIIAAYLDMQNDLVEEVKYLLKKQRTILHYIDKYLFGLEVELMERKYINGNSFSYVASQMGFSERQIIRIHGKALEKIDKALEEENLMRPN